ncbi:uncharacterized protein LOC121530157 [Drosophila eugracilis]|uniref:uncharacterized protein LOC121530157 n=1 Tax=Drosophila eugracilis TaxID=29029 RepID=UPI001BD92EDF|nr:uncharacterized protein LOC121530157 [Drosophila eugracilis]
MYRRKWYPQIKKIRDPYGTQWQIQLLPNVLRFHCPLWAPKGNGTDSVIEDYLAKVDVTVADIKEEDGELVMTIVDKQGRVLSARFALSDQNGQPTNPN